MASQIQDGGKQDLRNVMVTYVPLPPSPPSPSPSPESPHKEFQGGICESAISKRKQQQRRLATTTAHNSPAPQAPRPVPQPQLLAIGELRPRTLSNTSYSKPDPDNCLCDSSNSIAEENLRSNSPVTTTFGAPLFSAWSIISKNIIFLLVGLVFFIVVLFSLA